MSQPILTQVVKSGQCVAIKCEYREGDTVKAEVNTINRAELAAIKVALEVAPELLLPADRLATPSPTTNSEDSAARSTLNIATDSLTSMYQIWKWITRPLDLQEHRHKSILQAIGRTIEASAVPVHIWKVKSHIGIVGNETADETTVGVANGTLYQYERSEDNNNQHVGTDCVTAGLQSTIIPD
jgi:ribonuclease HI